jgi:hypothetical protein
MHWLGVVILAANPNIGPRLLELVWFVLFLATAALLAAICGAAAGPFFLGLLLSSFVFRGDGLGFAAPRRFSWSCLLFVRGLFANVAEAFAHSSAGVFAGLRHSSKLHFWQPRRLGSYGCCSTGGGRIWSGFRR